MNVDMKKISLILILLFSISIIAQAQSFSTFKESQATVGKITTQRGPSSVNWFDGGEKYSYYQTNTETKKREIRSYQPSKKKDELIFDGEGLMIPGTETPFTYSSFQWSADSKFLLFKSNFRPIYRNSGIADFYLYNVATKELTLAAKDARTAQLSPNGKMMGFERGGNLFIREMSNNSETQ